MSPLWHCGHGTRSGPLLLDLFTNRTLTLWTWDTLRSSSARPLYQQDTHCGHGTCSGPFLLGLFTNRTLRHCGHGTCSGPLLQGLFTNRTLWTWDMFRSSSARPLYQQDTDIVDIGHAQILLVGLVLFTNRSFSHCGHGTGSDPASRPLYWQNSSGKHWTQQQQQISYFTYHFSCF